MHVFISRRDLFDLPFALIAQPLDEATIQEHLIFAWRPAAGPCAIAAPSMKAALEAWGADSNLFHQGAAKESHDPEVIAATMTKPGGLRL